MFDPEWTNIPPVRSVDPHLGLVLGDIDSHMPAGHGYRDNRRVTWAHETTHGLNARIRNQYPGSNACYVLNDRAIILVEPTKFTLSKVASAVPRSLRGMSYDLYLIQQQRYWNEQPLYVLDEWSAYANGTDTAISFSGGDGSYSDVLQLLEFLGHGLVLASCVENHYETGLKNFRLFIMWMVERSIRSYRAAQNFSGLVNSRQEEFLGQLRTAEDTAWLRTFVADTYGKSWYREWICE